MNIKGKIKTVTQATTGDKKDGSKWHKCELVIDTFENPQYPKIAVFEVFGEDKIKLLQGLNKGQEVNVYFNIEGSWYNGKYYSKLSFWKIDKNSEGITNKVDPEIEILPF